MIKKLLWVSVGLVLGMGIGVSERVSALVISEGGFATSDGMFPVRQNAYAAKMSQARFISCDIGNAWDEGFDVGVEVMSYWMEQLLEAAEVDRLQETMRPTDVVDVGVGK